MNMMMNNPMMAILNVLQRGGNPMTLMQQMAGQNPQMRQFMQMINGKSPDQLRKMAENVAKERGVSINDVARQLGITVPSDK